MRQELIASICLASWAQLAGQPSPAWASAGSMREGRYYHQSLLLENGRLLVSGGQAGCVSGNPCRRLGSAELYDPLTGAWESAGDMLNPRSNYFAVRMSVSIFTPKGFFDAERHVPGKTALPLNGGRIMPDGKRVAPQPRQSPTGPQAG